MKTVQEIKLATSRFLDAFNKFKADQLEGVFIPFSTTDLTQQNKLYLSGSICFGIVFLYLFYNAVFLDAIFYWHIDFPVITGLITISIFFFICIRLTYKFLLVNKILKSLLENPKQNPYGVIVTDDYYFENTIDYHHIIPRENIVKIHYEERRKNNDLYIELLLDIGGEIQIKGINYNESEFDLKQWVNSNLNINSLSNK